MIMIDVTRGGDGRGAGYLGGGALTWAELFTFLKPNWEIIFEKVKVSLVDVVNCFVYICVSS